MSRLLPISIALTGLLLVAWLAFSPGFNSAQQFDDQPNLGSLGQVTSGLEALAFVFEGKAGPLGRPVALASFALQREHWPDDLVPLLQTNVALHLISGLMVFLLGLGLARALNLKRPQWVAVLGCALWLLSPFLASAPLMLIQRMTVLAGLFVFAGLASYVWGRLLYRDHPRMGLSLIVFGIGIGTLLAALSKENGALLPALALVIELTVFRKTLPTNSRAIRVVQLVFLVLPSALIAVYLMQRLPGLFAVSSHRDFLPMERAASQPIILWEYIRHLVIPSTSSVTPFTDDRQAVSGWADPGVLIAVTSWLAALSLAVLLRRQTPLFLFGLAFFLAGHALESSVIHLELYYGHRNYVPAFGLYFAIAAALIRISEKRPRIVITGAGAYVLAFGIILVSTTSLWGQPLVAAEIWGRQHQDSQRAQQFLANEYFKLGDAHTAKRILVAGASTDNSGSLTVQRLFTCVFAEPRKVNAAREIKQATAEISAGRGNPGLGNVILGLTTKVTQGGCDAVPATDLLALIDAGLQNQAYQSSTGIQSQLWNAKALIAQAEGNTETALQFVKRMYEISRHANHARLYSGLLVNEGRPEEALEFLQAAKSDKLEHPIRNWIRMQMIDRQIELIEQEAVRSIDVGTHSD